MGSHFAQPSRTGILPAVAFVDPIPDEVYLVVGQIVVRAAMIENLLVELCTAVRVDRSVTSAAAQAARQTWSRKPPY
jgi:hypothetical protein